MLKKLLLFVSITTACIAIGQDAGLVAEYKGKTPGSTGPFRVEGPWSLTWAATGDFDMLANVEITLYDADTGDFAGLITQQSGFGRGQKLVRAGGRYRIRVTGCCADWQIRVAEADEVLVRAIGSDERITELNLVDPTAGFPRGVVRRAESWHAGPGDNQLTVRTTDGMSYTGTFLGSCVGFKLLKASTS